MTVALIGVLHFSFTVSDLGRSIRWYTEVLGLELVGRQHQENRYTQIFTGYPDAVLDVARFKMIGQGAGPSGHILELVEYIRPRGARVRLDTNVPGIAHLAFLVDDIEDRYTRMLKQGVVFCSPPVAITEGSNQGGCVCYLRGPDSETIELLQPRHV